MNHFFQGTFSKIVLDPNLNMRIQCGSNENIPLVFQDWTLAYKVHRVFSFNNKSVWIFVTAHSSPTWSFLLPSWSKRYFNSLVDLHQAEEHSPQPQLLPVCSLTLQAPKPMALTSPLDLAFTTSTHRLPQQPPTFLNDFLTNYSMSYETFFSILTSSGRIQLQNPSKLMS